MTDILDYAELWVLFPINPRTKVVVTVNRKIRLPLCVDRGFYVQEEIYTDTLFGNWFVGYGTRSNILAVREATS